LKLALRTTIDGTGSTVRLWSLNIMDHQFIYFGFYLWFIILWQENYISMCIYYQCPLFWLLWSRLC